MSYISSVPDPLYLLSESARAIAAFWRQKRGNKTLQLDIWSRKTERYNFVPSMSLCAPINFDPSVLSSWALFTWREEDPSTNWDPTDFAWFTWRNFGWGGYQVEKENWEEKLLAFSSWAPARHHVCFFVPPSEDSLHGARITPVTGIVWTGNRLSIANGTLAFIEHNGSQSF